MFGIGWSELIVIALAFLVFVGPKDLPKLMNRFGRLMRELSNASRELRNQLDAELREVPNPKEMARELADEAEELAKGPYGEIREIDAQLKRDLAEAAMEPRFEPKGEPETKRIGAGTDDHAG